MIRGTTHDQDARFADKQKQMLLNSQWPDKYDRKVDLRQVDLPLLRRWIPKTLQQIQGQEDDIASGTVISLLEESLEREQKLDAKQFHVAVSGVLQDKTLDFVSQLWDLLEEAVRAPRGIVVLNRGSLKV